MLWGACALLTEANGLQAQLLALWGTCVLWSGIYKAGSKHTL